MAQLRSVLVWPPTGHRHSAWVRSGDNDAFVKTARRVCELYTAAVGPLGLEGPSSEIRLLSEMGPKAQTGAEVTVNTEFRGGWESVRVLLPRGIRSMEPQARGLLVLDVVHGAVVRLGQARGWDPDLLDTVRDRCVTRQLDYAWESPWKASPDRKLQARAEFRLLDHGFGVTRIVVGDQATGRVNGASASAEAFCTQAGFQRSAGTLRWHGSDRVNLTPFIGLVGESQEHLVVEVERLGPWTSWTELPAVDVQAERPRVKVTGAGPDAPEQGHVIRILGGGPMNGVPLRYSTALDRLLHRVRERGGPWWADSDLAILEVDYRFSTAKPGIALRRGHNRLKATINRPVATIGRLTPGLDAKDDVTALVEAITARQGLGPPPDL